MNSIVKYLRNHTGSTLMLTLITFAVLAILGMVILTISTSHLKMTTAERDYQAVYYIAEAGLNQRLSEVKTKIAEIYEETTSESDFFREFNDYISMPTESIDFFESINGQKPVATVEIDKNDLTKYTIKSTGKIGNHQRSVMKTIEVTWIPEKNILNDMAVFSNSRIALNGGKINGDFGTNLTELGAISIGDGNPTIENGKIFLGPGADMEIITKPHWWYKDVWEEEKKKREKGEADRLINNIYETREYKLPEFPQFPSFDIIPDDTIYYDSNYHNVIRGGKLNLSGNLIYRLNLDKNYHLSEIKLISNTNLSIDVGDSDREIVVDHLNIENGHIKILGTGKLTIYTKEITMNSSSTINHGSNSSIDIKRLNIYVQASTPVKTITFSGNQRVSGSIYAENANFNITSSAGIQGHIVTGGKTVRITGNASAPSKLIFAPNADVTVSGSGKMEGTIICNTFTSSGGAEIKFKKLDGEIPFFSDGVGGIGSGGVSPSLENLLKMKPTREL